MIRFIRSPWSRLIVLALLVVAGTWIGLTLDEVSFDGVREAVARTGPLGFVGFVVVYAAATTVFLPGAPLTLAAGVFFGPVVGSIAAWAGATLGAIGSFGLARRIGQDALTEVAGPRTRAIEERISERGFAAILALRLVPLVPFNLLNVTAGVSSVGFRDYTAATALGIIPGTIVYAGLGGTIDDPTSPAFIALCGAFVALTVAVAAWARRAKRMDVTPASPTDLGTP